MIVGAYAVFVHGEPRFSKDVDVALCLPAEERDRVRTLLEDTELHAFEWAENPTWGRRYRCFDKDGVLVELFMAGGSELQRQEYERRVKRTIDGRPVWFVSAEDLVLRKLVNARVRHGVDFDDAVSIIRIQGPTLDQGYIRRRCAVHRVCNVFDRAIQAARLS